jgi:iron complex outermembrane recepter protein
VVFVVGLTGALYVFEPELKGLYAPSPVPRAVAPVLPASELIDRAHAALLRAVDGLPAPESRWLLKADVFDGRLTSALSFYNLTRENVNTTDPVNPFFSIQTGEQRSRGVEWDGRFRILPGWELLAFYSFIDAEITKDTTFAVENRTPAVPEHTGGLWTTWEFQTGPLKGLGFGFGGRYVGERMVDLANTLELPDYVVLDASLFYRWGPLAAQVNFKNLTDKEYFTGNTRFVQPGEPFSVLGQLTWNFR